MDILFRKDKRSVFLFLSLVFILFYPMLISIYVFLPLCIGVVSYIFILGLEKEKTSLIVLPILYILNLEVNLSLPLFLNMMSILVFYLLVYPYFQYFRRCFFCRPLLSVISLDLMYLGILFFYDFVVQTQSIYLDKILLYSLIVDMIMVLIL